MKHFHDRATMAQISSLDLDPTLRDLLSQRVTALGDDLIDWTEYLVVEPGDTEEDIVRVVGFSPLVEPIDGSRWPDPAFQPGWDWLTDHGGWFELLFTFGSTFACVIFVLDGGGVASVLREMCVAYDVRRLNDGNALPSDRNARTLLVKK